MSQSGAFIARLTNDRHFGPGERARIRAFAGQGVDESVLAFDLFTGLWWRVRDKSGTPREVVWLVTKLYAACPLPLVRPERGEGPLLAQLLGRCEPQKPDDKDRHRGRFDALLSTPLAGLGPNLRWALSIARHSVATRRAQGLDWVQLSDDLSVWDRGEEHRGQSDVREEWAKQYLASVRQSQEKET